MTTPTTRETVTLTLTTKGGPVTIASVHPVPCRCGESKLYVGGTTGRLRCSGCNAMRKMPR